jgi:hypothetical protein
MNGTLGGTVILVPQKTQKSVPVSFSYRLWAKFSVQFFYPHFPDENYGQVKNRQTQTVIHCLYLLKHNEQIQIVKLPSVTCLKAQNLVIKW